MPKPPAEFSPLTTTRSSVQSRMMPGRYSEMAVRPALPTTSPTKRMRKIMNSGNRELAFPLAHNRAARRAAAPARLRLAVPRFAQVRQGAVVMSGTVADAVAGLVERRQRHQHDIGDDFGRGRRRFENSER